MTHEKIPAALRDCPQWLVWKIIKRGDDETKVPFQIDGTPAKSSDRATWATFDKALAAFNRGGYAGLGFVFAADDEFCGIDLDGCRDPATREVAPWAKAIIKALDSYSEVSPSQTGVKVFCRAKSPMDSGKKKSVLTDKVCGKEPAIEVYDKLRYFAVTGQRLAGVSPNVEARQEQVNALVAEHWPAQPTAHQNYYGDDAVIERARKYLVKLPPAESGQDGHGATFHAACVLLLGFGLSEGQAMMLLQEWNQLCKPPWTERELLHKVQDAAKQSGERNYLRNARQEQWDRIRVPHYQAPRAKPQLRLTTLREASMDYLERVRDGKQKLLETGLPDVDYALEGGVEVGEMVILAARPSHGKSAVALQLIHNFNAAGMSAVMISEEMSALALGKRVVQFASSVPQEHWRTSSREVLTHLNEHFCDRAECHVVESCGSADRAAEAIRQHVETNGCKLAVVDYAQLLTNSGKSRYEQVTNTSVTLRQVASECKIVLLVLCQLSRAIEGRQTFTPIMSDIKETGQLEQDADVILFQVWPWKLDGKRDPHEFLFFVGKNRNRAINAHSVRCQFKPSRQMFVAEPVKVEAWTGDATDYQRIAAGEKF